MPTATVDDVRVEIDTRLDQTDIIDVLDRVSADIDRVYDVDAFDDTEHRARFEAVLCALRIITGRDRRRVHMSLGSMSKSYEHREWRRLRGRVAALDPGGAFSRSNVRNDDRHYQSSRRVSNDS